MRQLLSHFRWWAFYAVVALFLFGGDQLRAEDVGSVAEGEGLSDSSKGLSALEVDTFFVKAVGGESMADDFTLKRFRGGELNLSSLRGRVVLLSFWATWCVPCQTEFPALVRLSEEFKDDGLTVVAIAADTKGRVERFISDGEYDVGEMVIVMDRYGSVMRKYGVSFFPMGVIVGVDGRLIGTMTGARNYSGEASFEYFRALLFEEFKDGPLNSSE